ncbi:MAG TPA: triose-phosphate isomerase [Patescibacteria group bacterium]|nr:triose-phosphate isomerase [Patescibacteria group bacterium]
MRRPLVIGNWKMNTTLADAVVLASTIKRAAEDLDSVEIVLCPPFVWLVPLTETLEHRPRNLHLGAQNMWFAEKGAMTGEISPLMLKDLVKYVILGHSERRSHFGESNALINDKIHAALHYGIIPVVCVGELSKPAEGKKARGRPPLIETKSNILYQLKKFLEGVSAEKAEKIVVAYEPVWAIGTGSPATGGYAAEMISQLRRVFAKKYGQGLAERVRILYGGSVDAKNASEFLYQPEIDGVLAGGASLKTKEFIAICQEASGRE